MKREKKKKIEKRIHRSFQSDYIEAQRQLSDLNVFYCPALRSGTSDSSILILDSSTNRHWSNFDYILSTLFSRAEMFLRSGGCAGTKK